MDHALTLMERIKDVLTSQAPQAGGWLLTRLEDPTYPFGTIDFTGSTPLRGQGSYMEQHQGVISVWTRPPKGVSPEAARKQAFTLSEAAHRILGTTAVLSVDNLIVSQFACGELRPRNPDGLTWGRSFLFTATTNEVN